MIKINENIASTQQEKEKLIQTSFGILKPIKLPAIVLDTGSTYEGQWKDGNREGFG